MKIWTEEWNPTGGVNIKGLNKTFWLRMLEVSSVPLPETSGQTELVLFIAMLAYKRVHVAVYMVAKYNVCTCTVHMHVHAT